MVDVTMEHMVRVKDEILGRVSEAFTWQTIVYIGLFLLAMVLLMLYAVQWQKGYSVYYTLIFVMIPVTILGMYYISLSRTANEALIAQKFVYCGGCFLTYFITMAIFELCNVAVPKAVRILMLVFNVSVFISVQTTEFTHMFYTDFHLTWHNGGTLLERDYGPIHSVYIVMILAYFAIAFFTVVFSLLFKKNVPKKRAILLLVVESVCFAAYFVERSMVVNLALSVASYVFAEIIFLIILRRISIYNVKNTVIDSITSMGDEGFISFDRKLRYIGSIGISETVFPELKKTKVDRKATKDPFFRKELVPLIQKYKETGKSTPLNLERGSKIYQLTVSPLYNGKKRAGYQVHIADDTYDRVQISTLDRINDYLQERVDEKTKHVMEMHDNLILSMATMVESRDNSTGGHIRRTSDCVRILIDEMKKDPDCEVVKDEVFCKNLIKAAPMHDLGKIAVPDAILQKPGRFEDWEFEEMKKHAGEGARIVHEILKGMDKSDDLEYRKFHVLAENVAHYHHERMDGSGYPDGLVGEQIPIEARIMAIADVYDALVSKRVYKERMPFDKADSIMTESFGKHFDPELEKYYVAARPRLEAYYMAEDE